MKIRKKQLISLLLFFCLIVGLFSFLNTNNLAFAQDSKRAPIKVAFAEAESLSYKNKFGNYSSYTYDYLQEIAQYTGWEYEFIEVKGTTNEALTKMLDMLKNGEVDLLGEMAKTDSTKKDFDFPEYSYGNTYKTLSILESNQDINESNFMTKKGLRIATYKNADATNKQLDDFCKLSNIDYELVGCESEDDILEKLSSGMADVAVGSDLTHLQGTRPIAKFSSTPFFFAVTKGNSKLINELNNAILTINKVKPFFEKDLYESYFSHSANDFFLSREESEYIKEAGMVDVAAVSSIAPLQFKNNDGKLTGIIIEILRIVSEKTGITFACTPVDSFASAFDMLKSGKVTAVSGIPYNYDISRENDLIMSSVLVSSQMVLVAKNNPGTSLLNKTVGIIENATNPRLDDGSKTVSYNTFEACLDDVINEKIDFAYVNLYSAEYYTSYQKYSSLRIIPQADRALPFCLGLKRETDPLLVSIINKALASISPQELETIVYRTTTDVEEKISFAGFLKQNPFVFIWFSVILFLVLLTIGFLILNHKMKNSRRLDIENQRYLQLCDLASEYIYEYDVKKDTLFFSQSFAKRFDVPLQLANYKMILKGKSKPKGNFNQVVLERVKSLYPSHDEQGLEECLCLVSTGERRWFRNTIAEIKNQDGETIYFIGKLTDIQKEREEKEKLEQSALTDGMTGLYNIVAFKNTISLRLASMTGKSALIIIDIDKFKGINDKLGHYTGDMVLKDFANTVKKAIGENDIAGRLGGDEFMIYIEHCKSCEEISAICSKLCQAARNQYTNDQGVSCEITISVGAVLISDQSDFSTIYKQADQQLYIAKSNGRDRYSVADCE